MRYLYHGGTFTTWGEFKLNEKQFPNAWDGIKKCVDSARAQGVDLGVHTLSNFITTNDALVTPVPDPGLAIVGSTELTLAIDAASDVLEVADGAWFENKGALRCARIGDELIQYHRVEGKRLLQVSEVWSTGSCYQSLSSALPCPEIKRGDEPLAPLHALERRVEDGDAAAALGGFG